MHAEGCLWTLETERPTHMSIERHHEKRNQIRTHDRQETVLKTMRLKLVNTQTTTLQLLASDIRVY